jgi:hypothetical protein
MSAEEEHDTSSFALTDFWPIGLIYSLFNNIKNVFMGAFTVLVVWPISLIFVVFLMKFGRFK